MAQLVETVHPQGDIEQSLISVVKKDEALHRSDSGINTVWNTAGKIYWIMHG